MKLVLIVLVFLLSACQNHKKLHKLELIHAYEVETNGILEPSGLTLWGNHFYTVSDKHDYIYQLVFNGNKVELKPIIKIHNDRNTKQDFEGITHDDDNFYLISEKYFQILKVSKDGKQQTWLNSTKTLKEAGEDVGLFQTNNANFEGICILDKNTFLLAVERQPRGFIEFNHKKNSVKAYKMDASIFNYEGERSPDFTGLSCNNGLYVLDRNADSLAKLDRKNGIFHESKGYSYKHIINNQEYIYSDMKYGQAEGLVVKNNKFYIILDNNRSSKLHSTKNKNSLFLILSK